MKDYSEQELLILAHKASEKIAYDPISNFKVGICIASKDTGGNLHYTSMGTFGNVATPSLKMPAMTAIAEIASRGRGQPKVVAYCFPEKRIVDGKQVDVRATDCVIPGRELEALSALGGDDLQIIITQIEGGRQVSRCRGRLSTYFTRSDHGEYGKQLTQQAFKPDMTPFEISNPSELYLASGIKSLFDKTKAIHDSAIAGVSGFKVSSSIAFEINGRLWGVTRTNVELSDKDMSLVSCAEASALAAAMSYFMRKPTEITLRAIYVMLPKEPGPPCGNCLQIISAFKDNPMIYLCTPGGVYREARFNKMLPFAFDTGKSAMESAAPTSSVMSKKYVKPALLAGGALLFGALGLALSGRSASRSSSPRLS